MRGMEPLRGRRRGNAEGRHRWARYVGYPQLVVALVCVDLAYRKLFIVPRALGSPRPTDDELSARTVSVLGDFGMKVEYIPFKQGSRTSCR